MKFITNPVVKWMVIPFLLFWSIAPFIPTEPLIQSLNWIVVAMSAAVCCTYVPIVIDGFRRRTMPRYVHLAIGIFLAWLAILMSRTWIGLIRWLDYDWMRESSFIAFYVYTSIIAGCFHMTAPGSMVNSVPSRNWIAIGTAVGVGILLGMMLSYVVTGADLFFPAKG